MRGDELDDYMKQKIDFFSPVEGTNWKWLDDFLYMEKIYFPINSSKP